MSIDYETLQIKPPLQYLENVLVCPLSHIIIIIIIIIIIYFGKSRIQQKDWIQYHTTQSIKA